MLRRLYLQSFKIKRFSSFRSIDIKREKPNDLLWKAIENAQIKSAKDWKNIRNEILETNRSITLANIDAMTVGICTAKKKYDLALSYLDFLKEEKISLNLATLGKHFKLLHMKGVEEGLKPEDEQNILMLYERVRASHPILEFSTLDSIIQALSLTSKWKLCIELLQEMKVVSTPSVNAYNCVISAAFLNNADKLGWKLLNEVVENDKTIHAIAYCSYFTKAAKNQCSSKRIEEIEIMFNFVQKHSLKIEANHVDDFVEGIKFLKLPVRSSVVAERGICKCCNTKLNSFDLSEAEFNDLKTKIVENVIIGKDVFRRTTSQELANFKNFVLHMGKFDIVIDGLNVAYSAGVKQPPFVTSGLVASVVSHFVNQGKKVLVLGRNHMNRWPRKNWEYITKNSTVFLTENLSEDDPYLLYCALNSGKDTIIVTRDLMRSHKFLLRDVHLKNMFDRWISQRQYQLLKAKDNGECVFRNPLPFSHIAQRNGNYWHIPCGNNSKVPTKNTSWLCIKLM